MTIKATFPDGTIMLFGDSYKSWIDQLAEYCRAHKMPRPAVAKCRQEWIGYGGLKWCAETDLQSELDNEGKGRSIKSRSARSPNACRFLATTGRSTARSVRCIGSSALPVHESPTLLNQSLPLDLCGEVVDCVHR